MMKNPLFIYADDGKSATNTKKRDDFNAMIKDALDGKIDMILTKSVSRFARNTVDSLLTIRKLKEKNVAVVFEKEGVNTLDGTGEILITILSSLAQEERRNISENTRWGVVRRFENGKMIVNHNKFMGYTKNENGEQEPDEYDDKIKEKEEEMVALIAENARVGSYTDEFDERYRRIAEEITTLKEEQIEARRKKKLADSYEQRLKDMDSFLEKQTCQIPEFDNDLVRRLIASIKVVSAEKLIIQFQSGIAMEQEIRYE